MAEACAGSTAIRRSVPPASPDLHLVDRPQALPRLFRSPFPPRNTEGCYITGKTIAANVAYILMPINDDTFRPALLEAFFDAIEIDDPDEQAKFIAKYTGEHTRLGMRSFLWRMLEQRDQITFGRLLKNIGLPA